MLIYPEQCEPCKHFRSKQPGGFCSAFPDGEGIPLAILDIEVDHRLPYPGDHGIRWEPKAPGIIHPFEEEAP